METSSENTKKLDYIKDLCNACKTGDLARVQYWLAQRIDVDNTFKKSDESSLFGPGVDFDNVRTPLHYAANAGHLEIVRILLESGANVNKRFHRTTSLHIAAEKGHLEVVQLLINSNSNINQTKPLYSAAQEGHLEVVQLLIDHNADVNQAGEDGWTPLHKAAREGHLGVVQLLIDHNAYLNQANRASWTPLYIATSEEHLEIVKVLIKHDANVYATTNEGKTILDTALHSNDQEIIKLVKKAIQIPWNPQRHVLYPLELRQQIATLMKLTLRPTQLARLPKDILLIICSFVVATMLELMYLSLLIT
jgi:ankyrin repeat protein